MPPGLLPHRDLLEDWLIAFAMAWTAVSALLVLFVALFFGGSALIDHRNPDSVQDYTSPDGKYVATLRTESGAALVPWYHSYVLVHPASVSTQEAIDWGKPYLVLRGDGDANVRWESSKVLNVEVLRDPGDCGTYEIAPMDQSQQILIHFKM
jgi:hypothetical protein